MAPQRLVWLLPLYALPCVAATWAQEPESVLGIKLGAPLFESISSCPKTWEGQPFCVRAQTELNGELWSGLHNLPDLNGLSYLASAVEIDGVVGSVELSCESREFERWLGLLGQRYGEPHSVESRDVKSLAGRAFSSRSVAWVGTGMHIVATERAGRLDKCSVTFESQKAADWRAKHNVQRNAAAVKAL